MTPIQSISAAALARYKASLLSCYACSPLSSLLPFSSSRLSSPDIYDSASRLTRGPTDVSEMPLLIHELAQEMHLRQQVTASAESLRAALGLAYANAPSSSEPSTAAPSTVDSSPTAPSSVPGNPASSAPTSNQRHTSFTRIFVAIPQDAPEATEPTARGIRRLPTHRKGIPRPTTLQQASRFAQHQQTPAQQQQRGEGETSLLRDESSESGNGSGSGSPAGFAVFHPTFDLWTASRGTSLQHVYVRRAADAQRAQCEIALVAAVARETLRAGGRRLEIALRRPALEQQPNAAAAGMSSSQQHACTVSPDTLSCSTAQAAPALAVQAAVCLSLHAQRVLRFGASEGSELVRVEGTSQLQALAAAAGDGASTQAEHD